MNTFARVAVLLAAVCLVKWPAAAQDLNFSELDRYLEGFAKTQRNGVGLVLVQNGRVIYDRRIGDPAAVQPYYVASAIKVVTATVMSMLHEEGLLSIDAPLGDILPSFRETAPLLHISHLLSHTSGLPQEDDCLYHAEATTAECVDRIGKRGTYFKPGSFFEYGTAPMQVAAHAGEVATGLQWDQIFEQKLGAPLGLECTNVITRDLPLPIPAAANGALSCLDDYVRIMAMIAQRGAFLGHRIASARAIARLTTPQVAGGVMLYSPLLGYGDLNPLLKVPYYGLGMFIDRRTPDSRPADAVSPGSSGLVPWVDTERNLAGVLAVKGSLDASFPAYVEIKKIIAKTLPPLPLTASGILNAASFENTSLAPGMFVSFYGNQLAKETISLSPDQAVHELAGASILIDGEPAHIFYASPNQINAIMPLSLAGKQTARVELVRNGVGAGSFDYPVQPVAPGLFPFIFDANWQPVTIYKPAHKGDVVILYLNGSGLSGDPKNPTAIAALTSSNPANTRVLIAGKDATVLFHGTAAGMFPGTAQINIQLGDIPRDTTSVPFSVIVDGVATQAGFTIPVE